MGCQIARGCSDIGTIGQILHRSGQLGVAWGARSREAALICEPLARSGINLGNWGLLGVPDRVRPLRSGNHWPDLASIWATGVCLGCQIARGCSDLGTVGQIWHRSGQLELAPCARSRGAAPIWEPLARSSIDLGNWGLLGMPDRVRPLRSGNHWPDLAYLGNWGLLRMPDRAGLPRSGKWEPLARSGIDLGNWGLLGVPDRARLLRSGSRWPDLAAIWATGACAGC